MKYYGWVCGLVMVLGCETGTEPVATEESALTSENIRVVGMVDVCPPGYSCSPYPVMVVRDDVRGVTCYTRDSAGIFCVPDAVRPTLAVDSSGL